MEVSVVLKKRSCKLDVKGISVCGKVPNEFQIRQKLKQLRAQRRHATDLDNRKTCPSRFANSSLRSVDWKTKNVNALLGTPANWKIVRYMPWCIRADSPRDEKKWKAADETGWMAELLQGAPEYFFGGYRVELEDGLPRLLDLRFAIFYF